jgi:outer membrane protein OmpA-like peptidoglycan-associated protein
MKKTFCFVGTLWLCLALVFSVESAQAQIWKKIKNEVKSRAENKVVNKAGNATDRAIDNTADMVKGNQPGNGSAADNDKSSNTANANVTPEAKTSSFSSYKSYDFVPGDKIIFQPDLSNEPDAELPARFTINVGNVEIQSYEGEKILHLNPDCHATVSPLMNSDHYLPEQYTLEFDMMYENPDAKNGDNYFAHASDFNVQFRKRDDNNYGGSPFYRFTIDGVSKIRFGTNNAGYIALQQEVTGNAWHHIAIYIRKNIGKVYIDQYRVAATNSLPVGAEKVDIKADRYGIKIKNVRLAAGGDDKYNKIVTDGKFITHGILFDVNKSTIKLESMGALNEIAKMMKEHNDLKFEIDGHTDSDGKADANLQLSQHRADAVKAKLTEMGIDDARLTTKGFGATKPIDKNDSAEGKANNRRVEFVKI